MRRSGVKKDLWKIVVAKSTLYEGKLACEFILKNSVQIDRAAYNVLVTGFALMYARLFDSGNEGVGCLPSKFRTFADPRLQGVHHSLLAVRNSFIAHQNARLKYLDEHGVEKTEVLKLHVVVGPVAPDGTSEIRAYSTGLEVPREVIPLYKALCEDLLPRLQKAEEDLLLLLYDGTGRLQVGDNPINIFDES